MQQMGRMGQMRTWAAATRLYNPCAPTELNSAPQLYILASEEAAHSPSAADVCMGVVS